MADDAAFDDDANDGGDKKGQRQGNEQGPVEEARKIITDDVLCDKRRVGAKHHHFAVGHVDDAHHAEGDGEADGCKQQDGAK